MLEVNKYTPRDRRIDVALLAVGGGAVLYLLNRSRTQRASSRFVDLWELQDPGAMQRAQALGLVHPSEVEAIISAGRVPAIAGAIQRLLDAPADWSHWDKEAQAVGAVMRPTYPETLLFVTMFYQQAAMPVGVFMLDFMDPEGIFGDQVLLARTVRHIEQQRERARRAHA